MPDKLLLLLARKRDRRESGSIWAGDDDHVGMAEHAIAHIITAQVLLAGVSISAGVGAVHAVGVDDGSVVAGAGVGFGSAARAAAGIGGGGDVVQDGAVRTCAFGKKVVATFHMMT